MSNEVRDWLLHMIKMCFFIGQQRAISFGSRQGIVRHSNFYFRNLCVVNLSCYASRPHRYCPSPFNCITALVRCRSGVLLC